MVISKELKLGVIAIGTILMMVWGYNYLKGQKLFATSMTLCSTYEDVYQLAVSSPVYINGLKVGSVSTIDVNPDNVREMTVCYYIEGEYGIPTDARAVMISEGVVGGKALAIRYDHMCDGDCVKSGGRLKDGVEGLLESMIPKSEISEYVEAFSSAVSESFSGDSTATNAMVQDLSTTMSNLAAITRNLDVLLQRSSNHLSKTMRNVDQITTTVAQNDAKIASIIGNLEAVSQELKATKVSDISTTANKALTSADETIKSFQATAEKSNEAIDNLTALLTEIQSGEGSMAQLINNPELYTNLEETSANLALLLQDLRLNPKRYVNVSVFGKKNKAYVKPKDDPAFE